MDFIINTALDNFNNINWDGPVIFFIISLAILLIFKKWLIFFTVLLTTLLGLAGQDLVIRNVEIGMVIMSVPFFVYSIGGGFIMILLVIAFFKFSI